MANFVRQRWQQWLLRWLDRRAPRALSPRLTHKNLYVLPNLQGLLFLLVVAAIWVMGTNYQNNLILGLSYLLISLFVASIFHAYRNLAGITLHISQAPSAFAGDAVNFGLCITRGSAGSGEAIRLRWQEGKGETLSLPNDAPHTLILRHGSQTRGYLQPQRLLLESSFPLGLIRCWSWLNLEAKALIYPKPIAGEEPVGLEGSGGEVGASARTGGDEFNGLRSYTPGDSPKHIAWKPYAQEKGLFSKQYQQPLAADKWLDWYSLNHPQEARLSVLCYWALAYEQQQVPYGLRLPGQHLAPALGHEHLQRVLSALALYNLAPAGGSHEHGR